MRVVLQRVSRASVKINGETVGNIGRGLLLLVGFQETDTTAQIQWMAEKVVGLRVFADSDGKMNLGLTDIGGGLLIVSQFTLYGDTRKGRRPSFLGAATPDIAKSLYEEFLTVLRGLAPEPVECGRFGAMMEVELVNDGPVTLLLER